MRLFNSSRSSFALLAFLGSAVLFAPPETHASTIPNGGFETPVVGANTFNSFVYRPTGASWTFAGGSGISGNNSGFTTGNPPAPEGVQVAFLQRSAQLTSASISQQISIISDGQLQITFFAAQRAAGSIPGSLVPNQQDFNVFLDTTLIGHFLPTSISYLTYSTVPTPVSTGSHTLSFVGLNTVGSSDNTAFLDNVQYFLSPIPEPGIYGLLLSGLGFVAWNIRYRRRQMSRQTRSQLPRAS